MGGLSQGFSVKDLFCSNIFGSGKSSVLVRFSVLALLIVACVGGASASFELWNDFDSDLEEWIDESPGSGTVTTSISESTIAGRSAFLSSAREDNGKALMRRKNIDLSTIKQVKFDYKVETGSADSSYLRFRVASDQTSLGTQEFLENSNNGVSWTTKTVDLSSYDSTGSLVFQADGSVSETFGDSQTDAYIDNIRVEYDNKKPQFNSTSHNDCLIGESCDYGAEVSDPDGSVSYTNLSLSYGGSTVVVDEQRTGTTSPEWNDVFTPQTGDKWLNATLEVVDDKGAVTEKEIDRYLSNDAPTVTINKPGNSTFWSYNNSYEVEVDPSGDSVPNETFSCQEIIDGNPKIYPGGDGPSGSGVETFTGSYNLDLGTHNLKWECSDSAGNTASDSVAFTVKAFEFESFSSSTSTFESLEEQFSSSQSYGEMVENVSYELVYDNSMVESFTETYSGEGTATESLNYGIPLVDSDGVSKDWRIDAEVEIQAFSGGTTSLTRSGSTQSQTVNQALKLDNQYLDGGSPQLEASDLEFFANLSKETEDLRGSVSGSAEFAQTGESLELEQVENSSSNLLFSNIFGSELVNSSSETHGFDLNLVYEFQGMERNISSSSFDVVLDQIVLSDSGGEKALRVDSFVENGSEIDSDVEANFEVWNPDSPDLTREYSYSSSNAQSHSVYLQPGYTEVETDVYGGNYIEYDAAGDQSDFYDPRNYYLLDETLNNQTSIIDLYLLEKNQASNVEITVENPSFEPLRDHVVRVERSFEGGSIQRTVAMLQTGTQGTGSVFIDPTRQYVFTIYNEDGQRIAKIGPQSIPQDNNVRLEAEETEIQTYDNLVRGVDFETTVTDEGVNVNFDTSSGESVNKIELKVLKDSMFESQVIESDSSSATSGQLTVSGLNASENSYQYRLNAFFDEGVLDEQGVLLDSGRFGEESSSYGESGLFVSMLLFIALSLSGLWRPEASIAMGSLALMSAFFIGFLPIGQTALIAVLSIAAVLVWRMS